MVHLRHPSREVPESIPVITFPDDAYEAQLRRADWIPRYVFSGGVLPSLAPSSARRAAPVCSSSGVTDIRTSTVRMLPAWRTRFLEEIGSVHALGFDERLVRAWDDHLPISEAGFATGMTQDLRIAFEKGRGMVRVTGAGHRFVSQPAKVRGATRAAS